MLGSRFVPTLAFAVLVVAAGPAWALKLTDDEAMATPCRTYLANSGSAFHGALVTAIYERLSVSPNGERFGSICNMADYVSAECRMHQGDDLRHTLDRLERAGAVDRLPRIERCGA